MMIIEDKMCPMFRSKCLKGECHFWDNEEKDCLMIMSMEKITSREFW